MQPARRYQPDAIIQRLPPTLANQIAAGEVVERPASIVKELVENALDAGATRIEVRIRQGGLEQIQVSDDGYGIRAEELELAVSPHATSKIAELADLENLASLGFRGEALASIGAVSRLVIDSRFSDAAEAWRLSVAGRDHGPELAPTAHPPGTSVSVSELFYNTPARRRFLRSERTEYRYIEDMLKRLTLSRFEVGFSLYHNQREIFRLPPATDSARRQRRVERLCGKAFFGQALAIDYALDGLRLWGWVARPEASRSQADLQYVYVNGRTVRDKLINHALRQACQAGLYPGRHPAWVLYLEVDPLQVDVNVHPTKHEVRFHQARQVHDFLAHALEQALASAVSRPAEPVPAFTHDRFHTPAEGNAPEHWQVCETPVVSAKSSSLKSAAGEQDGNILAVLPDGYLVSTDSNGALLLINGRAVRAAQLESLFAEAEQALLNGRPLLIPASIELSAEQVNWLVKQTEWLTACGFDLSPVGKRQILLRQVPGAAASLEPNAWLQTFVDEALAGVSPATALATALSQPGIWSPAEQQALVRDALNWQPEARPARYWIRWDPEQLRALFED